VIRKYKAAVSAATESEAYLAELSQGLDNVKLTEWKEQMDKAQRERISRRDAMDIFDTNLDKGLAPFYSQVSIMSQYPHSPDLCGETIGTLREGITESAPPRMCSLDRPWTRHPPITVEL
jgi:hypothetical protein